MQTKTMKANGNLNKREGTAKLPAGFHIEVCPFGSLHYAKVVDEAGLMRRWLPRPLDGGATLVKFSYRLIFQACLAGAVDPKTARAVEDARRAPNLMLLADALRQLADYFEHLDQCGEVGR
jgi:hypothetical protein